MEQKDENKKERKSQLLIAAIIFIAALGFVLNFGGDKLNNNLHYHKKYIEAVDDMMSETLIRQMPNFLLFSMSSKIIKIQNIFVIFVKPVPIIKTINLLRREMNFRIMEQITD